MDNDKLFELISKMYGEMQEGFRGIDEQFKGVKDEFKGVKSRLGSIESRVIIIEEDHGKKLDLLFDGYKQNTDKLDRIEKEVSRHDEIILRRVK